MSRTQWIVIAAIAASLAAILALTREAKPSDHGTGLIPASEVATAPPRKPVNSICPIMGRAIEAPFAVEYKGELIGLCCQPCVDMFPLNAEDYMKSLVRDLK